MIRLMNAAVMPREGHYSMYRLSALGFAERLQQAAEGGILESYIGYPACAEMLMKLTGVRVPVSRASTPVEDGDDLLIARLKYRVDNPAMKGQMKATVADYEFFLACYQESMRP